MSEWISVEEKMPKHDEQVLTWDGDEFGIDWLDIYRHDGPEWVGESSGIPTHWRPLPANPEANRPVQEAAGDGFEEWWDKQPISSRDATMAIYMNQAKSLAKCAWTACAERKVDNYVGLTGEGRKRDY